jgi:hypothetical protein
MSMVMPVPRRRQNYITPIVTKKIYGIPFHGYFLSFDGGESVITLDYKAKGESNMTMCAGCFSRLNQL